jgi:serine protease Do
MIPPAYADRMLPGTPSIKPTSRKRAAAGAMASLRRLALTGLALAFVGLPGLSLSVAASAASLPPETFADLAAKVTPAVVNISSTHHEAADSSDQTMPFDFPPGSPFEQFFKHFREQQGRDHGGQDMTALGSGFLIDSSGYIVTNDHVIDGATEIHATLASGKDYPARLIGADKKTDLALLKIDAGGPLPYVSWGDSDAMRVGDWVLAVGNPFGLGGTVTTGIISARSRDIHSGPFDDFLQIDASINRGNSGGPTFNLAGEVIGINSAIASPNGGSVGIGFAIPANMARPVIEALRQRGRVDRGWIGVAIQEVTPELAQSLGLGTPTGALVASVQTDGPAASALRQGDVILSFDGQTVGETRELPRIVANTPAGKRVQLVIWRDGARKTLSLTVAKMKDEAQVASETPPAQPAESPSRRVLGVQLSALTEDLRQQLGLGDDVRGVVITDVAEGSPAARQGLQQGDIIEQVAQRKVTSPREVDRLVEQAVTKNAASVLLLVNRQGNELFLAVKVGKA